MNHKFPYKWKMSDGYPSKGIEKHGLKVFSCFAAGGGSSMGYKLAGYDVVGCNEIDPKMMNAYILNHCPTYSYQEPIQDFRLREDLPKELYNLDILDGSPPCTSFTMAGNRDKDWGKKKKYREGQVEQVLDTLFFDFIALAEKLQPKIVIAENVKGLLQGKANIIVNDIRKAFDKAGYTFQYWLLDASKMGVPQRRERVFFICMRKDLAAPFLYQKDLFSLLPKLSLEFKEQPIPYKEFVEDVKEGIFSITPSGSLLYDKTKPVERFSKSHPKGYMYSSYKAKLNDVLFTILCEDKYRGGAFHPTVKRPLSYSEVANASTFPTDYDPIKPLYLYRYAGMSVPPICMAQIAHQVYLQWLSKM